MALALSSFSWGLSLLTVMAYNSVPAPALGDAVLTHTLSGHLLQLSLHVGGRLM